MEGEGAALSREQEEGEGVTAHGGRGCSLKYGDRNS